MLRMYENRKCCRNINHTATDAVSILENVQRKDFGFGFNVVLLGFFSIVVVVRFFDACIVDVC